MLALALPMLENRHHYNGAKRFAEYVRDTTPNDALIIAMDDSPFIRYYGHREPLAHPANPRRGEPELAKFLDRVDAHLVAGRAVYLIGSAMTYDVYGAFRARMSRSFRLTLVGEKLWENYHRPEMQLGTRLQRLYRVVRLPARQGRSSVEDGHSPSL
jgi:hypothetical protein